MTDKAQAPPSPSQVTFEVTHYSDAQAAFARPPGSAPKPPAQVSPHAVLWALRWCREGRGV